MGQNAVNESVEIPLDDEPRGGGGNEQNSFPMAIRELGEGLFLNYPDKTSILTEDNINGMIKISVLNEFMQAKYGYRYVVLDTLVTEKKTLSLSKGGVGIEKFIEILKSIQASFEQTQLPVNSTLQKLMRR
jgi:hypothetical protein